MAFDANDLSPHEHFVVERTRAGEIADFSSLVGADGVKPPVRAGFVRKLLLRLDPSWPVQTPGVRIKGARIDGALDLTDCSGAAGVGLPALSLEQCDIAQPIDMSRARLARFSLKDSALKRLTGDAAIIDGEFNLAGVTPHADQPGAEALTVQCRGLRVDGDVRASGAKLARPIEDANGCALDLQAAGIGGALFLDHGFEGFGEVRLAGARISGALQCEDGAFLNRSDDAAGMAINAASSVIGGSVLLCKGFKSEGVVVFANASIGGALDISEGLFRNDGGVALSLNSALVGSIGGAAKLGGALAMRGATVTHTLDLRGVELTHLRPKAGAPRADWRPALDAANIGVGDALLLQGVNVKGEVSLADARIASHLALGGARFINGGAWALRAPNAKIGGNLTLKIDGDGFAPYGQKTVVEGGAKFHRAEVAGAVAWLNLELRGPGPDGAKGPILSFGDARIEGAVQARQLITQQDATIDLSGASCATLDDDAKTGWGLEAAALDLSGFTFARLEASGADNRWQTRLGWLRRAVRTRFAPQPFTSLARVYAREGQRDGARRILLAQHDLRTRHASAGPMSWLLSSAFGLIAGYGFAPVRMVRALLLYLALGIAGVLAMNSEGALVTPQGQACNGAIEPALYAIDVALPVIDLGQENRCGPGRTARAELSPGVPVGDSDWRLFEGLALWKWAYALYAIFGALLMALAVITFSGMLKPRAE